MTDPRANIWPAYLEARMDRMQKNRDPLAELDQEEKVNVVRFLGVSHRDRDASYSTDDDPPPGTE